MRILGIDPGYAIVGFGALDYTRNTFTTLQYGADVYKRQAPTCGTATRRT